MVKTRFFIFLCINSPRRHSPKKFCSPRKSTGQPCFKSFNLDFWTWGISKILQNMKIINLTFYSEVNTFRVVRKYFGKFSTKRKIQKTIELYFFVHHWNPSLGVIGAALLVSFYFYASFAEKMYLIRPVAFLMLLIFTSTLPLNIRRHVS